MRELESTLDALVAGAPVSSADWQDVVGRAGRPRRRALAALVVAGAVGAIVVATPAFGIGERIRGLFDGTPVEAERLDPRALHALSAMASGVSPRLPASPDDDQRRFRDASFRQIATRNGRAYFVANRAGGGLCVSVADVDARHVIGSITCTPEFPSPARPILDESAFRGPVLRPTVVRLEGFAADGVASVAVVTVDRLEAITAVEGNVYSRTDDLPKQPVREIVALDGNGERLYGMCFVRGGCAK